MSNYVTWRDPTTGHMVELHLESTPVDPEDVLRVYRALTRVVLDMPAETLLEAYKARAEHGRVSGPATDAQNPPRPPRHDGVHRPSRSVYVESHKPPVWDGPEDLKPTEDGQLPFTGTDLHGDVLYLKQEAYLKELQAFRKATAPAAHRLWLQRRIVELLRHVLFTLDAYRFADEEFPHEQLRQSVQDELQGKPQHSVGLASCFLDEAASLFERLYMSDDDLDPKETP
jgi:hypothetical protein